MRDGVIDEKRNEFCDEGAVALGSEFGLMMMALLALASDAHTRLVETLVMVL